MTDTPPASFQDIQPQSHHGAHDNMTPPPSNTVTMANNNTNNIVQSAFSLSQGAEDSNDITDHVINPGILPTAADHMTQAEKESGQGVTSDPVISANQGQDEGQGHDTLLSANQTQAHVIVPNDPNNPSSALDELQELGPDDLSEDSDVSCDEEDL